jgi:acetyl-CoA carboxylase carboxyltransferase component
MTAEPDRSRTDKAMEYINRHRREYRREAMHVSLAERRGSVDAVIAPADTRAALTALLRGLRGGYTPGFVHDNLPQ